MKPFCTTISCVLHHAHISVPKPLLLLLGSNKEADQMTFAAFIAIVD
jgi:hypothetical protein